MKNMRANMIRTKGALEMVAELYSKQMFALGDELKVSLTARRQLRGKPLSLAVAINGRLMGGMRAPLEVANRRVDIAYVNPSAIATMAYRGKGFYKRKLPLRALACFPSWDRIGFAVKKELKITSLRDIAERKIPLRVSTREVGVDNPTSYAVSKILSFYGISLDKIKAWGGAVEEIDRPSSPRRVESIQSGAVNAVFDEALPKWLTEALAGGYELLNLEPGILRHMEALGFQRAVVPKRRFKNLTQDVTTVDFSGWPLITHKWLDDDIAYTICEAIDRRKALIPVDGESLDMRKLCRNTEDATLGIPLHPGARRYYESKRYLRRKR
jgi:TRAP-type uncharacterized transport system substrate-binding protein